jgi:hypothetical protein
MIERAKCHMVVDHFLVTLNKQILYMTGWRIGRNVFLPELIKQPVDSIGVHCQINLIDAQFMDL